MGHVLNQPSGKQVLLGLQIAAWVAVFLFFAYTRGGTLTWLGDIIALVCIADRVREAWLRVRDRRKV